MLRGTESCVESIARFRAGKTKQSFTNQRHARFRCLRQRQWIILHASAVEMHGVPKYLPSKVLTMLLCVEHAPAIDEWPWNAGAK